MLPNLILFQGAFRAPRPEMGVGMGARLVLSLYVRLIGSGRVLQYAANRPIRTPIWFFLCEIPDPSEPGFGPGDRNKVNTQFDQVQGATTFSISLTNRIVTRNRRFRRPYS